MRSSWLAPLLLLAACGPDNDVTRASQDARKPLYFDLKGFLDQQTALLTQRRPAVEKQVSLRDGRVETTRVGQVDWGKELQIFYQADINKPALRGTYEVLGGSAAADTVDMVRQYRRKPGAENSVDQLQVRETGTRAGTIEAILTQDNPLFFSRKVLTLHYQNGQLSAYKVQGVQKLVLFDTLRYSAAVRVL
jgi:hypothetical protein